MSGWGNARAGLLHGGRGRAAGRLLFGHAGCGPVLAPPSSPPTPVYPPPVSRQPDMLAFGQSTDFRTGLTTSVLELVRVPVANVYPAPTPGAEIPVASTTRVHNARRTLRFGPTDRLGLLRHRR
jgi:hypothetical protein